MKPTIEDDMMGDAEEEAIPIVSKGKEREQLAVVAPAPARVPVVTSKKPRAVRVPQTKEGPKFVVRDPKASAEKLKGLPSYKYASELMSETDSELVFKKLLAQPVTTKLREILGSSFELGRRLQTATKSQRFLVAQAKVASLEVLRELIDDELEGIDEEDLEESPSEAQNLPEFTVNSSEASPTSTSTKDLHEWEYQLRMQDAYERQFTYPEREANLVARPHEYRAMVTVRLNRRIGDVDYMMLVDSGSELNIMTLQQAQELALLIDDSGNSWTLKGISGHTMGLEGIRWNVPVRIGGMDFSHNFVVTCLNLGNKDMVLGQPWLCSHSTRIDYVHYLGVTLQLWENGDRKGRSVLINLPLVKVPRNVMPVSLHRPHESYNAELAHFGRMDLISPGGDPDSQVGLKFRDGVGEATQPLESDSEKRRPVGPKDLILGSSLVSPFLAEAVKRACSVESGKRSLVKPIEKLRRISPIYESEYTTSEVELEKLRPGGLKEGSIFESPLVMPYAAEVLKPTWHLTEKARVEMIDERVDEPLTPY